MKLIVRKALGAACFSLALAASGVPAFAGSAGAQFSGPVVHSGQSARVLPLALRPAFYRALAKDAGATHRFDQKGCATLRALTACFNSSGAHFTGAGSPLALQLVAFGRGNALSPVKEVRPEITGNQVSYRHGSLNAWWRVLPVGFEQGFTLAKRPAGHGELTLALAAGRQDAGVQDKRTVSWGKLHYGELVVTDANGQVIPASLQAEGNRILIAVNDARAVYPLTVDPLVWIEQKVTASDGEAYDAFGDAVAIEGTTALVGAPDINDWEGAVYAFKYENGKWVQAQKFFANDGEPSDGDTFGATIALDGTTALIGALSSTVNGNPAQGKAYIFTESNGTWSQEAKLVASDGATNNYFSQGVAIEGNTVLIGSYGASVHGNGLQGKAYIFTKSNGTWTQTQILTASDGAAGDFFGRSVALSGSSALVGSPYATIKGSQWQGAAYVFTDSNGIWAQTRKLTANDGVAFDSFGYTLAASGTTALISANASNAGQGAVYVFTESDGTWAQAQKLTASDGMAGDDFGYAVAIADNTAVIGADRRTVNGNANQGAAYLFTNSGSTWSQTAKFLASDGADGDFFGGSVAVEDTTALVASTFATIHGNAVQGAVYFYGKGDLGLALSTPESVGQGQQYVSQTIATNSASAASPAVAVTVAVPAAASFVSATATQGSCSEGSGVVTCDFGQIEGNAGTATANVTLKATGAPGSTIENTAGVAKATPALTASAATEITSSGSCPAGYTEFSGHLDAGETFTSSPIEVTEAGQKYVDLTAPASFAFFAITNTRYGQHTYVYPQAKHGHRWGAAGTYQVGVQAGANAGADYTLCVNLNPAQ